MLFHLFMEIKLFYWFEWYISSLVDKTDPVDNLLHLLKQPIFDKIRFVAFHSFYNKGKWFLQNESVYDLDSLVAVANGGCC